MDVSDWMSCLLLINVLPEVANQEPGSWASPWSWWGTVGPLACIAALDVVCRRFLPPEEHLLKDKLVWEENNHTKNWDLLKAVRATPRQACQPALLS